MKDFDTFYKWYLRYFQSKDSATATLYDKYMALSYAVRTHIADNWINTQRRYKDEGSRRVYYISLDYNFGRSLNRYIVDAGIEDDIGSMAATINATMEEISACEPEFDLGNDPKGFGAQCVLETLASQGVPAMGYGLWYEYGRFKQQIINGMQFEQPYNWKAENHPWNVNRPEYAYNVAFGGSVSGSTKNGSEVLLGSWLPDEVVTASPWDYPVVGYKNGVVNTVRFWEAVTSGEFHPDYQNHGDYARACDEKADSINMTRYLFPDGDVKQTTEVRIKQQYFLAAASLKDIVRRYKSSNSDIHSIGDKVVIHLTDSKCAIAVIEMVRILTAEEGVTFSDSLKIIKKLFIFSSHALSYDDLETWPLYLLEKILPLHANIIYEINHHILNSIREKGGLTDDEAKQISLIEEGSVKKIRLAHVAAMFSHYVTGASEFQIKILKNSLFSSFSKFFGTEFVGGMNGVSIRRWLTIPNPELSALITRAIGSSWKGDNRELIKLISHCDSEEWQTQFSAVKNSAKRKVFNSLGTQYGLLIPGESLLVGQFRKIHSAYRQSLELFYVIHRYLRLKKGESLIPRTYIIGGRSAPADFLGKQLVHLINMMSELINRDSSTNSKLQLFFIANSNASVEEYYLPAIDLAEYPSAKGAVAFSVDILKYVVNGAIPLMGSNEADQEVADLLGQKHVFRFKEKFDENEVYDSTTIVESNSDLKEIFEFIENHISDFVDGDKVLPFLATLRYNDEHRMMGVFEEYVALQERVDSHYKEGAKWSEWALHNISRAGLGSLDGIIDNFYNKVWM
jgi:starch phosphorylase